MRPTGRADLNYSPSGWKQAVSYKIHIHTAS